MTTCLHCDSVCRLTSGAEVYPHRPDLAEKPIWKCTDCPDSIVGCHRGTTRPLGFAADKATRDARIKLHHRMLDPLWKGLARDKALPKKVRKGARGRVYRFLAASMGLEPEATHTGMFTIEQCREAWRALKGQSPESIARWSEECSA